MASPSFVPLPFQRLRYGFHDSLRLIGASLGRRFWLFGPVFGTLIAAVLLLRPWLHPGVPEVPSPWWGLGSVMMVLGLGTGPRLLSAAYSLHLQRIPRTATTLGIAILIYVASCLGVPWVALAWVPGSWLLIAGIMIANLIVGGLAWWVLPRWAGLILQLLSLQLWLNPPAYAPWMAPTAWVIAAALLALGAWGWRRLCRMEPAAAIERISPASRARRSPFWKRAPAVRDGGGYRTDLTALRNDAAQTSDLTRLRIALGAPFAPASWLGLAHGVLLSAGVGSVGLLLAARQHWQGSRAFFGILLTLGVIWFLGFLGFARLVALFQRVNPDLSELALWPGIGSAKVARSALLRTTLGVTLPRGMLAAVASVLLAAMLHAPIDSLALLAAWCALALMLAASMQLRVISRTSGTGRREWLHSAPVTLVVASVLIVSTGALVTDPGAPLETPLVVAFVCAWLLVISLSGLALGRSTRAFQRLPHPFLQR